MQRVKGKRCTECGGDGRREVVGHGWRRLSEYICTHCHGSGMEPKKSSDTDNSRADYNNMRFS